MPAWALAFRPDARFLGWRFGYRFPMSRLSTRVLSTAGVLCAVLTASAAWSAPATGMRGPTAGGTRLTCAERGSDTAVRSSPEDNRKLHYLSDVRAAGHQCYDRVVFEFEPQSGTADPGYAAGYQRGPLREEGRGDPVEVEGEAVVVVRMTPARDVRLSSGHPEPTYRGPDSIRPAGARHIVEVRHVGSFEGNVTWAVGLRERRPFAVTVLESPPRLVVDVR